MWSTTSTPGVYDMLDGPTWGVIFLAKARTSSAIAMGILRFMPCRVGQSAVGASRRSERAGRTRT
eukprot:4764554-Prymnesium_polylepis.1